MVSIRPESEPSISDYGAIGDCHSAALISREGFVDWLCFPAFDAPSYFAGMLDRERGGHFVIRPAGEFTSSRTYLPGTNVLATTFRTAGGMVVLHDCMPVCGEALNRRSLRPDHELLRVLTGLTGEVELELEYRPRPDYGRETRTLERRGRLGFYASRGGEALVFHSDVDDALDFAENRTALVGRFTIREGERLAFSVVFAKDRPIVLPTLGPAAVDRLEACADWWRHWVARSRYDGAYPEAVMRSLLTLRLLIYAPSGGIVAAPTTSLPEAIGGTRNWDYRFCWLRDASLTVEGLLSLGYRDEAEAFLSWVLHTTRLSWPELDPLYDLMGHRKTPEKQLDHLAGHRHSRPVRVGNAAWTQIQLDSYGELIDAVYRFDEKERLLDRRTRRMLRELGHYVCRHWSEPDQGIWEIRSKGQHHTHSKAMCWVALDRLAKLGDEGEIDLDAEALRGHMRKIRETVEERGFREERNAYVSTFEGDAANASLLLLGRYGYADPRSARMRGTVDYVRRELERNGVVLRYRGEHVDDGVDGSEGAFGACCFWLVSALARQDDVEEAEQLFESLLARANDLGLYAEEIDPETGEALGNFPQAFTHIGLIDAALEIEKAHERRGGREEVA